MLTPATAAAGYCSPAAFMVYHDWQQVGDLVRDGDAPRPARAALLSAASPAGQTVLRLLLAASGELESAVTVGGRYAPADLADLAGASGEYLQKLVADLAFWRLMQRRQPVSADPKQVPGAEQAIEALKMLRNGERIFAFAEAQAAGVPEAVVPLPGAVRPRADVVDEAQRAYGVRGRDIYGDGASRFRGW